VVPDLSNLPTKPGHSARRHRGHDRRISFDAPAGAAGTFQIIGDLLRETDASPALRARALPGGRHRCPE